ncbi:MAG TPA: glycosyltransferase family 4 protein, partial [Pyrinomonadaceae bacterium]|nr:glycosyltransferase family 4 protein [Pyrinomonadaceae bacterium]
KREKIDVLHCHFLTANCWYAALSGFHPYVITIMGGGDVTGPGWKPDANTQSRMLTPYALRNADFITSWSQFMADVVRPFAGDTPIEVVHGGIHLERFNPGAKPADLLEKWNIPHDARVVFSPRLMRRLSNVLEIAQAADIIVTASPDTYFVVAFPTSVIEPDYSDAVREAFAAGAARDNVRFVSEISHTEIADYFRMADVTVSVPVTDGTPMTVLESMACGTPAVIGNLPDYDRQYFDDDKTAVMVDVNDPGSIADGVLRLLNDRELTERIANEARRRVVETGGYEFQMGRMEGIYRKLVRG